MRSDRRTIGLTWRQSDPKPGKVPTPSPSKGARTAASVLVPPKVHQPIEDRARGRGGDAGETRDDLPVSARQGPRRIAKGTHPVSAFGKNQAPAARESACERTARRYGRELETDS